MANHKFEFTRREKEVWELLGKGFSNKEIANYLVISTKTVETHLQHMCQKKSYTAPKYLRYDAIQAHARNNGEPERNPANG